MPLEDIYSMHAEYSDYLYSEFEERLLNVYESFLKNKTRAIDDHRALEVYMSKHTVSYTNWQGLIQWQGSEAQRLAQIDVDQNVHITLGYRGMFDKRAAYYNEFLFHVFKDKV